MEVKSVFMDLVEWVKKWNVWKLESEAFKKPIELKIWYENKELQGINDKFKAIDNDINLWNERFIKICDNLKEREKAEKKNQKSIMDLSELIFRQDSKILEQNEKINQLYDVVADLKTDNDVMRWLILQLQENNKEITQKLTKQPKVYHDKIFISWNENVMLWLYDIPDWDYLQILNIRIWEHNEYCDNKDEVLIDKVHSEDWYTPMYSLYGGTELDTPTAMVHFDLVLIPL